MDQRHRLNYRPEWFGPWRRVPDAQLNEALKPLTLLIQRTPATRRALEQLTREAQAWCRDNRYPVPGAQGVELANLTFEIGVEGRLLVRIDAVNGEILYMSDDLR